MKRILLIIGVLLLLAPVYYSLYKLNKNMQKMQEMVHTLGDTSNSTTPLMQTAGVIIKNDLLAQCLTSHNLQICQAAGITPQAMPVPSPQK